MKILILFCTLLYPAIEINVKCITTDGLIQHNNSGLHAQICPVNSHCLPNGYCDCDLGYIGGCKQRAVRMEDGSQVSRETNNQNYTFFEILGRNQTYIQFIFSLCLLNKNGSSDFQIDFWVDNGTTDLFSKQNALLVGKVYSISNTCLSLSTYFAVFGTKPNGQLQSFILGLKNVQVGTQQIKIKVEVTQLDMWDLVLTIILRLGGCFLLILSAVIIYVVYNWRRRRLAANENKLKNISHFETFMPKIKLETTDYEHLASEVCSICLLQFGKTQYLRKTVCQHIFHQDCLDSWCRNHLRCPICRRSFELKDLNNHSNSFNRSDSQNLRQRMLRQ